MTSLYPKGSEWRKWDLHIHTPFSICQEYGGEDKFDDFIAALEKLPEEVKVVGINDYYFIDGYEKVMEYKAKGRLSNLQKIFPVLEFRIDTFASASENSFQKVNLHVLFDVDESSIASEIKKIREEFINQIHLSNSHDTEILSKENLIKHSSNKTLQTGFSELVPSTHKVFDLLDTETWKDKTFSFLGYKEWNNLNKNDQLKNEKSWLYKRAKAFFTASVNDDIGKKEEVLHSFGEKPLVHSMDIHDFEKLKFESYKCFTWIKADPTFEGLKQIIYEPKERVKIQKNNPYKDRNKIFFGTIALSGSTNFILPDFTLPFNRELIALIGGRGSGKSALLDTFAFLNEEHLKRDQNNKKKIIEYYRDNEGRVDPSPMFNFKTTLIDKDGNTTDFDKKLDDRTSLELPFLYLGQEQLSGIATNDFELTKTVCELIGIDIDEAGQEILVSKARSILSDISNTEKQIENIVERYTAIGYTAEINIVEWIDKYLEKLLEQQKRLSSKETHTILEDINKKTGEGLRLKELNEKTENLLLGLRDVNINREIERFNIDLKKIYPSGVEVLPLDTKEQQKALSDLQVRIKSDMDVLRKEIVNQKTILIKQGIKEDVNSLLQASENLQRQITSTEKDLKIYSGAQDKILTLHLERGKVLSEIKDSLDRLKDAITGAYRNFELSRDDSNVEEKELFENIIKGIGVEGEVDFDFKKFSKHVLENFMDNRRMSNETELRKIIAGENIDGTPKEVTFEILSFWIQSDLSSQKFFNRGGLDRITEYAFTKWPEFLRVKAVAKLNGKPTEVLSIGQRGTLLLKVYLATSTAKQVFIIDQPEDNLDNSFIMHELVPLIRRAKKSRQIIMSTHNANLVVNADAEQVIVAKLDQGGGYVSGSIENLEINQYIRDILEGGEQAFLQRERKYQFVRS